MSVNTLEQYDFMVLSSFPPYYLLKDYLTYYITYSMTFFKNQWAHHILSRILRIQTYDLFWETESVYLIFRAVGRSENPGVPVWFAGHNLPPLVEIGWTDLPKSGEAANQSLIFAIFPSCSSLALQNQLVWSRLNEEYTAIRLIDWYRSLAHCPKLNMIEEK